MFAAHGAAGAALGWLVGLKLARVWRRLRDPSRWDRRTAAGTMATALVLAVLVSGLVWSGGGDLRVAGYNLLNWHMALGTGLALVVLVHALLRAIHRQRVPGDLLDCRDPRPLDPGASSLEVSGLVGQPLRLSLGELDPGDEAVATLDCTGGFYSTQRWRGTSVAELVRRARAAPGARHLRIVSHTGYRWSFPIGEAERLLLATHVGDEPLSHEHGGPLVSWRRAGGASSG